MSKTKRILDHLSKNPEHTWKDAEAKLSKHDIKGGYFAMVKSKHMGSKHMGKTAAVKSTNGEATTGAKRGPKAKTAQATVGNSGLIQAAEFAKSVGGIQNALIALAELEKVQIK